LDFVQATFFQRLLQVSGSPVVCRRKTFGTAGARFFTDWMPFQSPNQQCQSTEKICQQINDMGLAGRREWCQ